MNKYIEVCAAVRYWEDASVNGVPDKDGSLIPFRYGDLWKPLIRLDDGVIAGWPHGTTANIHYKVCDCGDYFIADENEERVLKWKGDYVPDSFLCHGDRGYGDYIILKVAVDGSILNWRTPTIDPDEWKSTEAKEPRHD